MMVHLLRHYSYSAIVNFVSAIFTRMAFGVWISIGTLACWQNAAHNGTVRLATTTACWIALNGHDCVLFSLFSFFYLFCCDVEQFGFALEGMLGMWNVRAQDLFMAKCVFVCYARSSLLCYFFASSVSSTQFALLRLFLRWWLLRGYIQIHVPTIFIRLTFFGREFSGRDHIPWAVALRSHSFFMPLFSAYFFSPDREHVVHFESCTF